MFFLSGEENDMFASKHPSGVKENAGILRLRCLSVLKDANKFSLSKIFVK
jgi:hypothetical protein